MSADFLWGVATSAYQSEGGYNGDSEPKTNWTSAELAGDVAVCGKAAEFWTRYREDFEACRRLGLNTFRLGIEWSRVQPTLANEEGAPPPFDAAAISAYAAIIAAARQHGLEPVVTLHHFVTPAWLGSDPWLNDRIPPLFEAYVKHVVREVNTELIEKHRVAPIKWFITINEPNMLVLNTYLGNQFPSRGRTGFTSVGHAYNNLLISHLRAYRAIHEIYNEQQWQQPAVTFNNYCSDLYWSDKLLLDLVAARERGVDRADIPDYLLDKAKEFEAAFAAAKIPLHKDLPYYLGDGIKRISNWLGYRSVRRLMFARLLDELYSHPAGSTFIDYIGLDYYDPFAAHAFRLPVLWDHEFKNKSVRSWVLNTITSKWWDWRVLPRGLHFFCQYYSSDFGQRQVLIAENGMAIRRRPDNTGTRRRDKITRSQFLRLHVHEVTKIVNGGVPLIGYLHWSLFDNYEWGSYTPRFGLFSLDYQRGTDRMVEDDQQDRPSEAYAALIAEAREKMHDLRSS